MASVIVALADAEGAVLVLITIAAPVPAEPAVCCVTMTLLPNAVALNEACTSMAAAIAVAALPGLLPAPITTGPVTIVVPPMVMLLIVPPLAFTDPTVI